MSQASLPVLRLVGFLMSRDRGFAALGGFFSQPRIQSIGLIGDEQPLLAHLYASDLALESDLWAGTIVMQIGRAR